MPKYFSAKEERMYEHIKEGLGDNPRAKEIAARTVNKYRAGHGKTKEAKKSIVDNDLFNSCFSEVLGEIEKGDGILIEEADDWAISNNGLEEEVSMEKSFDQFFTDDDLRKADVEETEDDLQKAGDNPRMAEQNAGYESSNQSAKTTSAPRSAVGPKRVEYEPTQSRQTQEDGTKKGTADYSRVGNDGSNKPAGGFAPRSSVGSKTVHYNPHQSPNIVEKSEVKLPVIHEGHANLLVTSHGNDYDVAKKIEKGTTSPQPSRNALLESEHNRQQREQQE